jgi:hypothetical protein
MHANSTPVHRRMTVKVVIAALLTAVVLSCTAAVATAATSGSIVVVRRAHAQDSLWMVSPTDASATKLTDLSFRPARLLASPDGTKIALLPSAVSARVYVYYLLHAKLAALSFAPLGVRQLDGMTWLSSTRLMVSGSASTKPTIYPFADRLYTVTTTPGKPVSYRHLRGSSPTAAPSARRLLYVRLLDGGPDPAQPGARFVTERLMSLRLVAASKPHILAHVRYVNSLDIRRFHDPELSPDGRYVITSTTGSDISVRYAVRSLVTNKVVHSLDTAAVGRDKTAWSQLGDRVAFWGMPKGGPETSADLYVYDAAAKKQTADGPFAEAAVTGLAWAPDDSMLAYSLRSLNAADDKAHLWMITPGTSSTPTDLGAGSLPVWLP